MFLTAGATGSSWNALSDMLAVFVSSSTGSGMYAELRYDAAPVYDASVGHPTQLFMAIAPLHREEEACQ